MFSKIVPPNSQVSCSTIPIRDRSDSRLTVAMSTPSTRIRPESTS